MLRDYQQQAVNECRSVLANNGTPLIVLPTGAGKSHIIAEICHLAVAKNKKVLVLAHRSILLTQNASKLRDVYHTFCSAQLGQKNLKGNVVFATRGSIIKIIDDIFDIILIDEAHKINNKQIGQYRKIIDKCKKAKIIGLSATPYRLEGAGNVSLIGEVFTDIVGNPSVQKLIKDGFLCKLVTKSTMLSEENKNIPKNNNGEYSMGQAGKVYAPKVVTMANEFLPMIEDRKSVIIFCCSVEHVDETVRYLSDKGQSVVGITGKDNNREKYINDFKAGKIKILVGCEIFTEGFDHPAIDCVILLRPTQSPSLYVQMVGRGLRICEGKIDCLILDYGGNAEKHGSIDRIHVNKNGVKTLPFKICPICDCVIDRYISKCSECGFEFPKNKGVERQAISKNLENESFSGNIFGDNVIDYQITKMLFNIHTKNGSTEKDGLKRFTLKVQYLTNKTIATEYLCFNHQGFARQKAERFWRYCANNNVPKTTHDAMNRIREITGISKIRVTDKKNINYLEVGKVIIDSAFEYILMPENIEEVFYEIKAKEHSMLKSQSKGLNNILQAFPGSRLGKFEPI